MILLDFGKIWYTSLIEDLVMLKTIILLFIYLQ